jgi:hypothetical protein
MANGINEQKLIDSNRRALVKYVATVDSAAANVVMLDVSSLAYSLNTNGKIMSSNTNIKSLYRTSIKRVWGQGHFKSKGFVTLRWGGANTEIISIGDGQFDYNFDAEGLSASIGIQDVANATGDIVYSTAGVASGDGFTLFIDLKKDGRDYDQGQTRDPAAFNVTGIL